jgi:hypothetical protein
LKTRDRTQALDIATRARNTLADWPRQHLGYRQHEVAEIVSLLDEAISNLRAAAGMTMFDLSLVAMAPTRRSSRSQACRRCASSSTRCFTSPRSPSARLNVWPCCRPC